MILHLDDARNIITLLNICERDYNFRLLVEKELKLLGIERNLTKKTRELIIKGVLASIGMSLNYEIEEEHTLEDMAIDKEQNTENLAMKNMLHEKLFSALGRIPPVERALIIYKYGLRGEPPMSYKSLSKLLNRHPKDLLRIEKEALEKLRLYIEDEPVIENEKGIIALLLAIEWGREDEC